MLKTRSKILNNFIVVLFAFILTHQLTAKSDKPREFENVGIDEKLGSSVSIDKLQFTDEEGIKRNFSEYFNPEKPVILIPGYYRCPQLCSLIMNGFTNAARNLKWTIGEEFKTIFVSVDPRETSDLAKDKKENYLKHYGRMSARSGWHFLTGDKDNIEQLMNEVGYRYHYDKTTDQYAHTASLIVLTPEGKISRYLYGIDFKHKDLKLSLLEGSQGKIGTVMEQILLFCFRYDPDANSYSFTIMKILEGLSYLTVFILFFSYMFWFWRQQRISAQN